MGAGVGTMPSVADIYAPPSELVLGKRLNSRVPAADQHRQRGEVEEILRRLRGQSGLILADEVGMGKTFVALAIAYSIAIRSPRGPAIVMAPANLVDKWEQDLKTFCELYLENRHPVAREGATRKMLTDSTAVRYGVVRHSIELMKLIDDPRPVRCHLIFVAQGAMGRRQTDKWIRLALIGEALRRHGRGRASRLIQVKNQIHRFLAELLWAMGEERANDLGEELWQRLLQTDPAVWKDTFNNDLRDDRRRLTDDPVPKSVTRAMRDVNLKPLAEALEKMPVRAQADNARLSERLDGARKALRQIEEELWKDLLAQARWRSPLLVMDEAHHLKNPGTSLARQLQSPDSTRDLRTGDGAMANSFDRMLFLTATPFQLGHSELVRVLERFGDVRWETDELGERKIFERRCAELAHCLNGSQRTAVGLQHSWSRLRPEDCDADVEDWWQRLLGQARDSLTSHQRAVVDAYTLASQSRDAAQAALRPWIVRHNKGTLWAGTDIVRRQRVEGAAVAGQEGSNGLPIPPQQLLPFLLAARSAIKPGQDLLGEALCSSYEAFRYTRQNRDVAKDEQDEPVDALVDLSQAGWYLSEFDTALKNFSGAVHPKLDATVRRVVDLWEAGEKVLVFAFYRHTCRALRVHISQEIERRINLTGRNRLLEAGLNDTAEDIDRLLERIQRKYFDDTDSPGRRAVDAALIEVMKDCEADLERASVPDDQRASLTDVMRRFLRVPTTLIRCFPIARMDSATPEEAVGTLIAHADSSGMSWRAKFKGFIRFLTDQCSTDERRLYLEAALRTQTGGIRVEDEDHDADGPTKTKTLANVQVATGTTRREARSRLMRAFNTPFFPDILVCSEVMGEGVDLQRFCRHVVHHDLAWNPSTIEQRTGRIDRLGCKAEGRQPVVMYLPYLAGTADERQFRVMSEREQWFRVVMGQDEVARLITPDSSNTVSLPQAISDQLAFELGIALSTSRSSAG